MDIINRIRITLSKSALDLGFVLLFTFLAYLFVLIPPFNQTPLRIVFALPLLLFLPGYVLIAAMFPRKDELSVIERFTLSIGLSIAIFVFDGFAISVTAWRFRPTPIIYSLSLITLTLMVITFIVRLRVPKEERFSFDLSAVSKFFESLRTDEKPSDIERALIIALVGSIIIASGMLIYAKVTFEEEQFTAFYILGAGGKAESYPKDVYLFEPSSLIVGIENYEHAPANYTLQVNLGDYSLHEQQITLAHGEKWEDNVSFTPKHVAKHAKLEFMLYKDGSANPYRSVHLWVDSLIDYDNLAAIRDYTLSDLPLIKNPDMEQESNWNFTGNTFYFRGHFTKFYRLDENATVCGYVVDNRTGAGLANARVRLENHYGYEKSNITNEHGYYAMQTIADHFWMESTVTDYKKTDAEFEIAGGETRVVNMTNDPIMALNLTIKELKVINESIETLPPEQLPKEVSTAKGYVLDEVTGLPIVNASVTVRNEYGFVRHTTTNESGYFEVDTVSGNAVVEARKSGYAVNTTKIRIASVHTVNPIMSPADSIVTGYIYNSITGDPVSNVNIKVSSTGYSNTTRSDASGHYTVRTIAGPVKMDISKTGYLSNSADFNITYGETRTLDMQIEPKPPSTPLPPESSTISGYVSCNNVRLPGAAVVISDHDTYETSSLTDNNGYFEIATIPGHLWLDVLPSVYMDSSVEFDVQSGQRVTLNVELDAFSVSTYQIDYPSKTPLITGYYGGMYQDITSDTGLATLSFKVSDSYRSNKSEGYLFKQVLLNNLIIWEDDVAEDEGWQSVTIPITLDNGTNRVMLRMYAKQDSKAFPLTVWWDDVRIEPFEEITKERATNFYVLDANGTEKNYPTELYLGEPAEVLVGLENNEHETVNYTVQVKLNGEVLESEEVRLEEDSQWEQIISFTPNQVGALLKLEVLLFKDHVKEKPYQTFHLWVSSDVDYDNLAVLNDYVVSPLPAIITPTMESIDGWTYMETDANFTGELTDSISISPWYSYEISYPAETPLNPGSYGAVYQSFTTDSYPATVVIAFNVKDSYTGASEGFLKQVLLNETVIWEDDVAGDERWQHVKVPVTLHSTTNKLSLRVYGERASSNFPIHVWWDDVRIEPITAVAERIPTSFYILDSQGTEENYPTDLHLGESAEFLTRIENNEHESVNYILQIKSDGRVIKTESKWLEHGSQWNRSISVTPDELGDNQKLEFLLFKGSVKKDPYRYFHLWVATEINYDNLESLLIYGIQPLPAVDDGNMKQISAWTFDHEGSFTNYHSTENTSKPYSYEIRQQGASNKGDYGELWQTIYAENAGVVVLSVNVRDSFEYTSDEAKNITKQVMLNDDILWTDDVSGKDTGYVGWVVEEYSWIYDEWWRKSVPGVKSGWKRIDVPVYLFKGNNKLSLTVIAEETTEELPVKVYWDDVEIRPINDLVKAGDTLRMKRYGW